MTDTDSSAPTFIVHRDGWDTVRWKAAQAALADEVDRVVGLLRSVRKPGAHAVGDWNLADVAMHLSQAWIAVPGLAAQDLSGVDTVLPERAARHPDALIGDIWDLAGTTVTAVRADPERNPAVLADRIEERARRFLASCAGHSPTEARTWLVDGVKVPLSALTGHLLNETMTHGYDIARADGRRWALSRSRAAMVIDGFLMPVFRALDPSAMVNPKTAAKVRATFDVRIRGGGRYHFVFDRGTLAIEPPAARRVDCHLSLDPAAFLLVAWNRQSQWRAIASGRFLAWGRKPWLGPRLRAFIRNP